jgi:hypothetical protein
MSFLLEHVRDILGADAVQLSLSPAAARRVVTCVTCITDPGELGECAAGELVVLSGGNGLEHLLLELAQRPKQLHVTGFLAPAADVSAEGQRRLRQLATSGDVGFGLLASGIEPRAAANRLGRALGSRRLDPALQRLHTAENLQTLVDTLAILVGNSVTIETPNHELLASSPTGSDVDRNREETILQRHGTGKIMDHPDFERYMAQVRGSDWPIHIPPYPELGFAGRVVMRVAAEGEIFAIFWVTDTARPLTQDDYAVIRQAADVAAPIFLQQRTLARREAQLRAELLDDVIQGRISSPENVRTVARTLG